MFAGLLRRKPVLGERLLNRLLVALAVLVVVSIAAFAAYYYTDRQTPAQGPTPMDNSIAQLEQAVTESPDAIEARLLLANAYFAAERYADAAAQYQAAVTIDDKSTLAHFGLGQALLETGDLAGATANFQKIIDISAGADIAGDLVGGSYLFIGQMALDQGRPDEAIAALKEATRIDRGDADALYLLGRAYVVKGSFDEALPLLKRAVAFVPDFGEAYTQMALAYDGKGMANEARYARAMAAYAAGQLDQARADLEAVTAALPSFADGFVGLGLVREQLGQREAAAQAYQKAVELEPENFNARAGLGRLGALQTN